MIWTFALGKCYGRGALNRFLVVLILIETIAVLIMKVSLGVNNIMRWVFNFFLFWIFPLMVLAYEMSNSGGGVEYDMIFIARNSCLGFYASAVWQDSCFCVAILASVFNVLAFRYCVTHVRSAGRPHFLCSRSLFFSSSPFMLL